MLESVVVLWHDVNPSLGRINNAHIETLGEAG
jgi:hypothetical protein